MNKKLWSTIREHTYIWTDNYINPSEDDFIKYIENFDFVEANKDRSWGFRWYQYIGDFVIDMWDELDITAKSIIFVMGCDIADQAESAAEQAAGEDW